MIPKPLVVIVLVCAAGVVESCASTPDDSTQPHLQVPNVDPAGFGNYVEAVFERRCASLDCHGQIARGMRLYSENGLRLPNDAGLTPGNGATSIEEINANYIAIIGLQPEKVSALLANPQRTSDDVRTLLILSKPLELERHKGGPALKLGEPAEECIVGWLLGDLQGQKAPATQGLCLTGAKPP
jgi:hypothetical protein